MNRRFSVVGSGLLMLAAASFVAFEGRTAPAAPDDGGAAADANRFAARPVVRTASVERDLTLAHADGADPSTRALVRTVELLREGLAKIERVPAYTATFEKREVVNGVLLDPQVMDLTLRHEPFGVHMTWVAGDRGRTLLYEAGRHDGRMLVNPGGWRGRLTGTLRLEIDGGLAMREARHPITEIGLEELGRTLLRYRLKELNAASDAICSLSDGYEFAGRPAWRNEMIYRTPAAGGEFRRSVALIDREWGLPVSVKTYGWPSADMAPEEIETRTLIERYSYTDVDFGRFADAAEVADLGATHDFRLR